MPPKKAVEEKKILLGRPGNNLKVSLCNNRIRHRYTPNFHKERVWAVPILINLPIYGNKQG